MRNQTTPAQFERVVIRNRTQKTTNKTENTENGVMKMEIQDNAEEKLKEEWEMSEYDESEPCPNCKRFRLCDCDNGKRRCEKCNWVPEDNNYCPVGLDV